MQGKSVKRNEALIKLRKSDRPLFFCSGSYLEKTSVKSVNLIDALQTI